MLHDAQVALNPLTQSISLPILLSLLPLKYKEGLDAETSLWHSKTRFVFTVSKKSVICSIVSIIREVYKLD